MKTKQTPFERVKVGEAFVIEDKGKVAIMVKWIDPGYAKCIYISPGYKGEHVPNKYYHFNQTTVVDKL